MMAAAMPMVPQPKTTPASPGCGFACLAARPPTVKGSMRQAV